MSEEPLVSAIIPCYNEERYLENAVESVNRQTYGNLELIIIDDCSKDDSVQIARNILEDSNLETRLLLNDKNRGVSFTRNKGVKKSDGKYVSILDADDEWNNQKIEKQVNLMENNEEIGIVYTNFEYMDEDGNLTGERNFRQNFLSLSPKEITEFVYTSGINEGPSLPLTSSAIRKTVFEDIGHFDDEYDIINDRDFLVRAAQNWKIKIIDSNLMKKRYHSKNISADSETAIKDHWKFSNNLTSQFEYLKKFESDVTSHLYIREYRKYREKGEMMKASIYLIKSMFSSPSYFSSEIKQFLENRSQRL